MSRVSFVAGGMESNLQSQQASCNPGHHMTVQHMLWTRLESAIMLARPPTDTSSSKKLMPHSATFACSSLLLFIAAVAQGFASACKFRLYVGDSCPPPAARNSTSRKATLTTNSSCATLTGPATAMPPAAAGSSGL